MFSALAGVATGVASLAAGAQNAGIGDTVADRMGVTYSFTVRNTPGLNENQTWQQAWKNLAAGVTRISPERSYNYWDPNANNGFGRAKVEFIENEMKLAHANGTTPVVKFIFLPRFENGRDLTDVKWFEVGKAFAERYRIGSQWNKNNTSSSFGCRRWMILNEIDGPWYHVGKDKSPENTESLQKFMNQYRNANRAFAQGVRASDPSAEVYLGPLATGWVTEGSFRAEEWVKAAADLLKSTGTDRIDGFGLHTYPTTALSGQPGFQRKMDPQVQYNDIIAHAGLQSVSPKLYTTEAGVEQNDALLANNAVVNLSQGLDQQVPGQLFLASLWNHLSVKHVSGPRDGQLANEFTLAFSPFDIQRGQWVSMATDARWHLKNNGTFAPNSRGLVYQLITQLTKNVRITKVIRNSGTVQVEGRGLGGQRLYVRAHYPGDPYPNSNTWSVWAPPNTSRIQTFYWNSVDWRPKAAPQGVPVAAAQINFDKKPYGRFVQFGVRPGETCMAFVSGGGIAPFENAN